MMKRVLKSIKRRATSKKTAAIKTASILTKSTNSGISVNKLFSLIENKAFEIFEARGYAQGDDRGDWYEAEKIVKKSLLK